MRTRRSGGTARAGWLRATARLGSTVAACATLAIAAASTAAAAPQGGPQNVYWSGPQGGPFPTSSTVVTLQNATDKSVRWRTFQSVPWMSTTPVSGFIPAGGTVYATAQLDVPAANTLAVGTYTADISYRDRNTNQWVVAVHGVLDVLPPNPTLEVTPAADFHASGLIGGPFSPNSTSYVVTNPGGAPLDWTAAATQPWVSLSSAGGSLAAGASATVNVSLSGEANNLALGVYSDTITFTNTTNGLGNATRLVRLSVNQTLGQPMTTASRTSGVAPLTVFFDAVGANSSVVQPVGAPPDYASFHYRWDFDDVASGTWAFDGKAKNDAMGYVAAHVFEAPGNYHVTLQVTDANGDTLDYFQDITVADPATVYAGSTYFVSNATGNDANSGLSPNVPFKTLGKGMSVLFASNGPRRLLLNRGETWTVNNQFLQNNRTGPYTIGAYGTGNRPKVHFPISAGGDSYGMQFSPSVVDVRITDVDFQGLGGAAAAGGVQLGSQSLLLRSRLSGFNYGLGGHDTDCIGNTFAECEVVDNYRYGVFYAAAYNPTFPNAPPTHLALLGNRFDNNATNSLIRTYVSRSLWQHNWVQRTTSSATRLLGAHEPWKSEFNIISDNLFESVVSWVLEIGPENDENGPLNGRRQIVENVILEGNKFRVPYAGDVSKFVKIWGSYVTVRNNIFDFTRATQGEVLTISPRGIGPVPVGVKVDNNTVYRSDAVPSFVMIEQCTSQDTTEVRNNIIYAPNVPGGGMVGFGSLSSIGNLTINPLFVNPGAGDFQLQPGSAAINHCVAAPVRADYFGNRRPLPAAMRDVGALEAP